MVSSEAKSQDLPAEVSAEIVRLGPLDVLQALMARSQLDLFALFHTYLELVSISAEVINQVVAKCMNSLVFPAFTQQKLEYLHTKMEVLSSGYRTTDVANAFISNMSRLFLTVSRPEWQAEAEYFITSRNERAMEALVTSWAEQMHFFCTSLLRMFVAALLQDEYVPVKAYLMGQISFNLGQLKLPYRSAGPSLLGQSLEPGRRISEPIPMDIDGGLVTLAVA